MGGVKRTGEQGASVGMLCFDNGVLLGSGCLSVAIEGADKNTIVVIGDNMDRKKVGGAELITVAPVDDKKKEAEKKDEKKPADNKKPAENIYPVVYTYYPGQQVAYAQPPPPYYTSDPSTIL
ncbi:hypothetical protein ACLOJK_008394 [Asimina triloba]